MADLLSHFTNKYQAEVVESRKRFARIPRMSYNDYYSSSAMATIDYHVEQGIEVTLSKEQFHRLIESDYYIEKSQQDYDYNQKVVDKLRADERVRMDHESVQLAYKKYQMLLELARK